MSLAKPATPPIAALLTACGTVPFAGFAALAAMGDPYWQIEALGALLGYGVAVLSFLGGIHWGFALAPSAKSRPERRLLVGVVPPLAGWAATQISQRDGFLLLALAFVVMLALDIAAVQEGAAPQWYRGLRLVPTLAAVIALLFGAFVA